MLEFNIICGNAFVSTPDSGIGDDEVSNVDDHVAGGNPDTPPDPTFVQNDDDDDDDPDDGGGGGGFCCCPFNDDNIDAILLILNQFVLLILRNIGCDVKKAQLIGKQAKRLLGEFDNAETVFHPGAIRLKGKLTKGNAFQMQAVNSFVSELIRTHPFHGTVGDDEMIFNTFKEKLTEEQPIYAYLFASSFAAMKEYKMDIEKALSRFRQNNWASNMKKTTYSLDEAQLINKSEEFKQNSDFIFQNRQHTKPVQKPKVSLEFLYKFI